MWYWHLIDYLRAAVGMSKKDADTIYRWPSMMSTKWMNLGLKREASDVGAQDDLDMKDILKCRSREAQSPPYVESCERLARRMYSSCSKVDVLSEVLDVGCGFGDQACVFRNMFPDGPRYMGINVGDVQVQQAQVRVAHLKDVDIIQASATDLAQFSAGRFSRCFSLECAFHFDTRAKFWHEASRVLAPGGEISLMDVIFAADEIPTVLSTLNIMERLLLLFQALIHGFSNQLPPQVEKDLATYEASVRAAGFEDVKVTNITAEIVLLDPRFKKYVLATYPWWSIPGIYYRLSIPMSMNMVNMALFVHCSTYVQMTARKSR